LADRRHPADLAPVAVTLCGRKTRAPHDSHAFQRAGHITGAGTLHGQSPGWQAILPFFGEAALPLCCPAPLACGNYSWEAERDSGIGLNCSASSRNRCSPSSRNTVRVHARTPFGIIPESRSHSHGIPSKPAKLLHRTLLVNLISFLHSDTPFSWKKNFPEATMPRGVRVASFYGLTGNFQARLTPMLRDTSIISVGPQCRGRLGFRPAVPCRLCPRVTYFRRRFGRSPFDD
jgi:hypothetical protein